MCSIARVPLPLKIVNDVSDESISTVRSMSRKIAPDGVYGDVGRRVKTHE
jgi:hypothetical protein